MPLECGRTLSHAILTVSTAISGGSLTEYISSLQGIYSAARIAAFLQPVSQDFTLPSPTPNGISLSAAARAALLAQTGAQPFFSRELCAKYFTYLDADGQAHFVLYDDDSTLAAKLAQLAGCGVPERVRAVSGCGRAAEAADVRQHCTIKTTALCGNFVS